MACHFLWAGRFRPSEMQAIGSGSLFRISQARCCWCIIVQSFCWAASICRTSQCCSACFHTKSESLQDLRSPNISMMEERQELDGWDVHFAGAVSVLLIAMMCSQAYARAQWVRSDGAMGTDFHGTRGESDIRKADGSVSSILVQYPHRRP